MDPKPFSDIINKLKVNKFTAAIATVLGRYLCRSVDHYVFVANTGRCGSNTLQKVLENQPDCISCHEPHPTFAGDIFREYNELRDELFLKEFYQRKLPNIYWSAKGGRIYIETSNMFIKVFEREIVRVFGPKLKVINLVRNKIDVAASYYHRHEFSSHDASVGRDWILHPTAARNCLKMEDFLKDGGKFSHPFFRYLWYCYEIEARTNKFKKTNPEIAVLNFRTEDLNDLNEIKKLFSFLELPINESLEKVTGLKYNSSHSGLSIPAEITKPQINEFDECCKGKLQEINLE